MTLKEKSKELVEKYFNFVDCGENIYSTKVQIYNAKQCALIAVENEYWSRRELLFDLKSSHVIESDNVYLKRLDDTFEEEKQIKQEIMNYE